VCKWAGAPNRFALLKVAVLCVHQRLFSLFFGFFLGQSFMSQLHATLGTRTHHSSAEISHPSHAKLASCSSYYVNAIRHGPSSFLSLENPQRMQPMSLYRRLSLNCRKSQVIDIIQQPSETDRSNDQQTGRQASRQISNNYPKTTNIFLKTHVATIKLKDITWKSSPNV